MAARAAAPSAAARAVPGRLFAHARQTSTSQRDPVRRRRGDQDGASTGCRRWHNSACVSLFLCFHFSAKSDSGREARPLRPRLRMRGPAIFKSAPLCSRPASVSTSKLRLSRLLSPRRRRSRAVDRRPHPLWARGVGGCDGRPLSLRRRAVVRSRRRGATRDWELRRLSLRTHRHRRSPTCAVPLISS